MSVSHNSLCSCHECGLHVNLPILNTGEKALCPRCSFVLTTKHKNAINRILAFSVSAIIFLLVSIPFEFLSFKAQGLENKLTITQSIDFLFSHNYGILAIIQLLTIFIIPLLILCSLIYVLSFLKKEKLPPYGDKLLTLIFFLLPWAMVEIFLVGVLVSLVKILAMADIGLGPSFISLSLFALLMTAVVMHIDKHEIYSLFNKIKQKPIKNNEAVDSNEKTHKEEVIDASKSIQTTWALLITAIVFYIPANVFPIMDTQIFGQEDPSTIFGGVLLLWHHGSYPIAIIIFVASIAVPVTKFIILGWLNYSVQKSHSTLVKERIKLYRAAEMVGRWSMIDVFVVIILASLIQLGNTVSIYPGAATLAFSGSVIVTMLAAITFEPKLIWQEPHDRKL